MLFRYFCISALTFYCHLSFGQTENEQINQYIERYIENSTDEVDIQQLASDIEYYLQNPLYINKAETEELFNFPIISNFQAIEILEHRQKFGDFISIYELQLLESFTVEEIKSILPFVKIYASPLNKSVKNILKNGEHQLLSLAETHLPLAQGYTKKEAEKEGNNHYQGSPIYTNLRYRFDYKKLLSFGINTEKDAGEHFIKNQNVAFDYQSIYASVSNIGIVKQLNIGDFQANFGQGLTLSTGLAFGKSSLITSSKRNFNGFKAYRSLRENAFLRGGAVAIKINKTVIGSFVSYKKTDGNGVYSNDSIDSEPDFVTNIQEDGGLHRTQSEIEDKDLIKEFQTGAYAERLFAIGKVGVVTTYRKFNTALIPTERLDNAFQFKGDSYSKTGGYYDFAWKNFNVFGEVSYGNNHSKAFVNGLLLSVNRNLDLSFVYRKYSKEFIWFQSNGFGENSKTNNEEGIYSGFELKLAPKIKLIGYYDLVNNPWLSFQTNAPSVGNDLWTELQYKPSKQFAIYYRYRREQKQKNFSIENIKQLQRSTLTRNRIHISYSPKKGIEFRTRAEWNNNVFNNNTTYGSLLYQDIIYKPFGKNLQLTGRIANSNIESFDNRIYSFEQVPLYDYPMFAHSFTGIRTYLMCRYAMSRNLQLWFRYANSHHQPSITSNNNQYQIGTGVAQINGRQKSTFTLQIRYKIK